MLYVFIWVMVLRRTTQLLLRNSALLRDNRQSVLTTTVNNHFVQRTRFISISSNVSAIVWKRKVEKNLEYWGLSLEQIPNELDRSAFTDSRYFVFVFNFSTVKHEFTKSRESTIGVWFHRERHLWQWRVIGQIQRQGFGYREYCFTMWPHIDQLRTIDRFASEIQGSRYAPTWAIAQPISSMATS